MKTAEVVHLSPPVLRVMDGGAVVAEVTIPVDQARLIGGKLLVLGALEDLQAPELAYDPRMVEEAIREIWPASE